jgi:hypothetical protein
MQEKHKILGYYTHVYIISENSTSKITDAHNEFNKLNQNLSFKLERDDNKKPARSQPDEMPWLPQKETLLHNNLDPNITTFIVHQLQQFNSECHAQCPALSTSKDNNFNMATAKIQQRVQTVSWTSLP